MFSKSDNVPFILEKLRTISHNRNKKLKVLDIGCGWGKWGFLIRGWLDCEKNGPNKEEWQHKIDAVEVFEPYITPAHKYIYDQIIIDDFRNLFQGYGLKYDLIIMGDCLEHVPMKEGKECINRFRQFCDWLIISVPGYRDKQQAKFGNPYEEHQAWYEEKDFKDAETTRIGSLLTAIYQKKS